MQEILNESGVNVLYIELQHSSKAHSVSGKCKLTFENEVTKYAALA